MSAAPRTRTVAAVATAVALAGCGGGRQPATRPARPVALEAAAVGRAVVAEVNGKPIYSDCVATQARAHKLDRRGALDECVDFELLAQAAARRGYADRPAVLEARDTEMVRAFIARDFSPHVRAPGAVPAAQLKAAWKKIERRFNHPAYRVVYSLRVPVAAGANDGGGAGQAARALAFDIYRALAGAHHLTAKAFRTRAQAIAGTRKLVNDGRLGLTADGRGQPPALVQAVFAVPATGMLARPARVAHGWRLSLLVEIIPAAHETLADLAPKLRGELYRALGRKDFLAWVKRLANGYHIEVHPERLSAARAAAPVGGG